MKKYKPNVCTECGGRRVELTDTDFDGVTYKYWNCTKCGEKVLDMNQLHEAAESYRKIKSSKISRWGSALAIRIPKEIARRQKLKVGDMVRIVPEKSGFKIFTEKPKSI